MYTVQYSADPVLNRHYQCPELEFLNILEAEKTTFQESCLFKGESVQQGLQWLQLFMLLLKIILYKQLRKTSKLAKIIYILILYLKSLETYLETLHSHFQLYCHFKMFKNSGSDQFIMPQELSYIFIHMYCTHSMFKTETALDEQNPPPPLRGKRQWREIFSPCILLRFFKCIFPALSPLLAHATRLRSTVFLAWYFTIQFQL